ncbi:thioredoxin [Candidatus Woesearchaeota archaeon]|nr:thioredoxin [Candidatus Woesearchaeota archaeon]
MPLINLHKDNFNHEVLESKSHVLVDFFATWCGPCRMMEPVLDELSDDFEGHLVVAKINIDEEQDIAEKYQIGSIPCLILFKDGRELHRFTGFMPLDTLIHEINKIL